ncbi:MAG: sulfurtransferase [Deltaproteobacteria bacterium]|nr:MAG: sulfurtransferase [Deltaproteobacteria bacterium]
MMSRLALPALSLLLLVSLAPACGGDGGGEPLGTCGLPISQCESADTSLDDAGADAIGADALDEDAAADTLADDATGEDVAADTLSAADDTLADDTAAPVADPTDWIVDGAWLAAHLEDDGLVVIDVRDAGSWTSSRIPGALHIDVADVRATVDGVPSQVAGPEQVAAAFAAAGLEPGTTAIVAGPATDTTTARLVWTLRYYGHDARLLDGGYASWSGASDSHAPATESTTYPAPTADDALRVTGAWVIDHLEDASVALVDARSAGEYGSGHIPGAYNVPWTDNVSGSALKDRAAVAALYTDLPAEATTLVAYCASGTRASVTWLVLRWLGYEDVRLYDGSWAEWSTLSGAPVEP